MVRIAVSTMNYRTITLLVNFNNLKSIPGWLNCMSSIHYIDIQRYLNSFPRSITPVVQFRMNVWLFPKNIVPPWEFIFESTIEITSISLKSWRDLYKIRVSYEDSGTHYRCRYRISNELRVVRARISKLLCIWTEIREGHGISTIFLRLEFQGRDGDLISRSKHVLCQSWISSTTWAYH